MPAVGGVKLEHVPFDSEVFSGQGFRRNGLAVEGNDSAAVHHTAYLAENFLISGELGTESVDLPVVAFYHMSISKRVHKMGMDII